MTSEADLQKLLDADPTDWQTRLILADWLEEHAQDIVCPRCGGAKWKTWDGIPCEGCGAKGVVPDGRELRAVGYRALGELQIRPLTFRMKSKGLEIWGYHNGIGIHPKTNKTASWRHVLPRVWFRGANPAGKDDVWCLTADGRDAAENIAAVAFGYLLPEEQSAVLAAGRSRLRCAAAMGV